MPKQTSLSSDSPPFRGAEIPLLISLNVLLEECNVTRAARRLHVSQPALSAQLSRLRLLLRDPLLVPAESGRGLVPSPFALKVHRRLRPALTALLAAVRPNAEEFNPEQATRTFNVVTNDIGATIILPGVASRIQVYGNKQLRLTQVDVNEENLACRLERGELDLCFSDASQLPPGLLSRELVTTPYVLIQRANHPRGSGSVVLEEYCTLDHVNLSHTSNLHGILDEQLYRLGHSRHVTMAIRDFNAVCAIVAHSNLVCTVPACLAPYLSPCIKTVELDFPFLQYTLCMAWLPAMNDDPDLAWLRNQVLQLDQSNP